MDDPFYTKPAPDEQLLDDEELALQKKLLAKMKVIMARTEMEKSVVIIGGPPQ